MEKEDLCLNNNAASTDDKNHQGSQFVMPTRLSGCLITSRQTEEIQQDKHNEDVADDMIFENPRQQLAHYLLTGRKVYILSNGAVTTEKPEPPTFAIVVPPGKFSLIGEQDGTHPNEGEIIFDDQRIKDSISELINSQRVEVFSGDGEPKFNIPEQGGQIVQPPHQTDDGAKQSAISLPEGRLAGKRYPKSDTLSFEPQNDEFQVVAPSTRTRTVEENERLEKRREELKQILMQGGLMKGIIREDCFRQSDDSVIKIDVNDSAANKTENETAFSTREDEIIFSYALICLRKGFNYDELEAVFSHISEFEKRFPYVADKFHRSMDNRSILMLTKGLFRAMLLSGGKVKLSKRPDDNKDSGTFIIPKGGLM